MTGVLKGQSTAFKSARNDLNTTQMHLDDVCEIQSEMQSISSDMNTVIGGFADSGALVNDADANSCSVDAFYDEEPTLGDAPIMVAGASATFPHLPAAGTAPLSGHKPDASMGVTEQQHAAGSSGDPGTKVAEMLKRMATRG